MTPRLSRIRAFALAALVVALAAPASAATPFAGRIVGTVTDAATGETLIGASARIAGTSIGASADVNGRFTIPNAPSGAQSLVVSYVGYWAFSTQNKIFSIVVRSLSRLGCLLGVAGRLTNQRGHPGAGSSRCSRSSTF